MRIESCSRATGYVNTNTGKSCFHLMADQIHGLWQSPKEMLHKVRRRTSCPRCSVT